MMPANPVKATCKGCGQQAAADSFKLHYKLKMMVCPNCFTGKTDREKAKEAGQKEVKPSRPAGWDAEDEYLEKTSRARKEQQAEVSVVRIPGSSNVQFKCPHCKYPFKYNPETKVPRTCPYCDKDVTGYRAF